TQPRAAHYEAVGQILLGTPPGDCHWRAYFTPCRAGTSRTASTSLSSATANCAGLVSRHSWFDAMAAAALAPSIRSLSWTSPLAFSSPPWITTHGALRLSPYLSCGPILPEPR